MSAADTPLMRQYHSLKQQVPNALLLFRLGDFYELFFDDAVTAARELEITLTSRSKDKEIPMCGVPHHSAENYIAKLIQRGYRVAVCEQTEDPKLAKKLVKREITRVITPGTTTEANVLRSRENNYLAAIQIDKDRAGIAFVDVSTGEFRATEVAKDEVNSVLESLNTREVLVAEGSPWPTEILQTPQEAWLFAADYSERMLREHFRLSGLDGIGLDGHPLAIGAAGVVLHYLKETQKSALGHLDRPTYQERGSTMILDAITVRNLELLDPLFAGEKRDSVLISVLDDTRTGMGARLIRRRILQPSLRRTEIESRLDQIEELVADTIRRTQLRESLSAVMDLERLVARITLGSAGPRELLAMGRSIAKVPLIKSQLSGSIRLADLNEQLDELADLREAILNTISEEPPVNLNDSGTVQDGVDAGLDELRDISRNSKKFLAGIEIRERERTNIGSLKIRFNNVFGYYLEISKSNLHLVPADYERKQTLVNAERFTTAELKELEVKILEAEERILEIERRIFSELRQSIMDQTAGIKKLAQALAEIDVAASLAQIAGENRYCRPQFSEDGALSVLGGRHPVVEQLQQREAQRFIPNDLHLDLDGKFVGVITGPNMGGKSTYLRQAALYSIMAQAGSFVPAQQAKLPIVDRVFTRIGAADNLARGRSTFMVEMTETALILNTATRRSLIVLDEIGRGTSTFDGLALAWAVIEFIHEKIGARTLFATHYHELTELEKLLPGVRNLHVAVKEAGDNILFLRKVEPGKADRSYGIEVARLAALPHILIERAKEVLAVHEQSEQQASGSLNNETSLPKSMQISLFEPVNHGIAERIRQLKLNDLRPIEALQILEELQQELNR
jgi:DNA mismatch repair protein MutS